jgi:hypothetical protein
VGGEILPGNVISEKVAKKSAAFGNDAGGGYPSKRMLAKAKGS